MHVLNILYLPRTAFQTEKQKPKTRTKLRNISGMYVLKQKLQCTHATHYLLVVRPRINEKKNTFLLQL